MVTRHKRLSITLAVLLIPVIAAGWFTSTEYWEDITIAYVNGVDVQADGADSADEAGTVKLPVTVTADFGPGSTYDIDIEEVRLQYSTDGGSSWTPLTEYTNTISGSWASDPKQQLLGQYQLTEDNVGLGTDALVRLQVQNPTQGKENADTGVDTTAEGTNGWQDQWVTGLTTDTNKRPKLEASSLDLTAKTP